MLKKSVQVCITKKYTLFTANILPFKRPDIYDICSKITNTFLGVIRPSDLSLTCQTGEADF